MPLKPIIMKSIFTSALFFASTFMFSQQGVISVGIDLRNASFGSEATSGKPAPNINIKASAVGNKGTEIGAGFEFFPAIDYNRMYVGVGQQFSLDKSWIIVPSIEPSIINRRDDWGGGLGYKDNESSHLTIGLNVALRYKFSDSFSLQFSTNALPRPDLAAKYNDNRIVVSGFAEIVLHL